MQSKMQKKQQGLFRGHCQWSWFSLGKMLDFSLHSVLVDHGEYLQVEANLIENKVSTTYCQLMRVVILLIFMSWSTANAYNCRNLFPVHNEGPVEVPVELIVGLPVELTLELTQVRPLVFADTDVFRRNNDIGLQQVGELRLEKWIEIDFDPKKDYYNFVGLNSEGRIYQAIDWHGQRRIARQLSGEKLYDDLFIINNKILGAVTKEGQVHLYSPYRWRKSPKNRLTGRGLVLWSGVSALTTAALFSWNSEIAPVLSVAASAATAMQVGFIMLFHYDRKNTFPDGFIKTKLSIPEGKSIKSILSQLTPDVLNHFLLEDDLNVPDRSVLFPRLTNESTEDIR